ncbi:MAG: helix-turn-helix transcriptional regulator [Gammaproteobacteria bacterium]|nr:helix-turn-helix transcriptional regulator [Gammaproteobacteria bacterium]
MSTITDRLRKIREAETSGREEFSRLIDVSKSTIASYEQTGRPPRAEIVEKVAKKWPQYAFWLITGKTENKSGNVKPR